MVTARSRSYLLISQWNNLTQWVPVNGYNCAETLQNTVQNCIFNTQTINVIWRGKKTNAKQNRGLICCQILVQMRGHEKPRENRKHWKQNMLRLGMGRPHGESFLKIINSKKNIYIYTYSWDSRGWTAIPKTLRKCVCVFLAFSMFFLVFSLGQSPKTKKKTCENNMRGKSSN